MCPATLRNYTEIWRNSRKNGFQSIIFFLYEIESVVRDPWIYVPYYYIAIATIFFKVTKSQSFVRLNKQSSADTKQKRESHHPGG